MTIITTASGYGAHTRKPFVSLMIGDRKPLQISPDEARELAGRLLECADAAEGDAFIVEWFTEQVGLELPQVGALLRDFRASRERRRE